MVMYLQEKINLMEVVKVTSVRLIFLMLIMQSCMSQDEQVKCLNSLMKKYESKEIVATLKDSIHSWSNKELKGMSRFDNKETTWKIDALLINSSSDRLFGWILQVDNDLSKDALDYVKFYSGEQRDGKWFFYLHNMPKTWADREKNENKKYTFEQLSEIAKKEVLKGGLIKENCKINDSYINDWIDREGQDLYKWHKDFLQTRSK